MKTGTLIALSLAATFSMGQAQWNPLPLGTSKRDWVRRPSHEYLNAIQRTADMANDEQARRMVERHGLNLLNLSWEDTGRYKGSSVGPNISDMTIQVGYNDPDTRQFEARAMPVIRFPNFSDKTADIRTDDFTLMVGNHRGRGLQRVSLTEFLADPDAFMSRPDSWTARTRSLLAPRDSHVLVSAQACFLPIPEAGKATFNPVLFNYQSSAGSPAVLTILATREGTSMTVIDNQRDAFPSNGMWGQRLFHNDKGMRASLTGERESDFFRGRPGEAGSSKNAGMSMVLVIQVPLKQREPRRYAPTPGMMESMGAADAKMKGGIDRAVIGHGDIEGPFTEMDGLAVERDQRFPVRVTVQFYKATDDGKISDRDVRAIKSEIESVYAIGDSVGSLVTQGETGRPTEYWGCKVQPAGWWEDFWARYERDHGISRREAMVRLERLLGRDYRRRPVCDLYLRDTLRRSR